MLDFPKSAPNGQNILRHRSPIQDRISQVTEILLMGLQFVRQACNSFINRNKMRQHGIKYTSPEVEMLANRMRMGSGINELIKAENAPNHHMDSLERFKKDFASFDREQRNQEMTKKQMDIERKRLEYLERQNQRWEKVQHSFRKQKEREYTKAYAQMMGEKKTANSNGLAYNPINLSYDDNAEGKRLKLQDEDRDIRRFVRARNMDDRGNSKYDLISGRARVGVEYIVPEELSERYSAKLSQHYDSLKIRPPSDDLMSSPRSRYY